MFAITLVHVCILSLYMLQASTWGPRTARTSCRHSTAVKLFSSALVASSKMSPSIAGTSCSKAASAPACVSLIRARMPYQISCFAGLN